MDYRHITVVFIFLLSSIGYSEDTFTAEGVGLGANQDEALMAAKRDAVEKGIGMILLSQSEVENFQLKRDVIITKTAGTVTSYKIISKSGASDGLIEIKIKATLSKSAMRQDLAAFNILIESMAKPRVMVLIDENNIGNNEPANRSAESAILKFLKDPYNFDLIDRNVSLSIRSSKQKMAELSGDLKAAVAIGTEHGAEVLITGSAISRIAEGISKNLGGMVSVQADITLKAINCTSGRIIASENAHAAKVHVSPQTAGNQAISKAAEKAVGKLLDAIIKDWQNQLNNGLPLTVRVTGVKAFRQKKAVIASLRSLGGVSTVNERSWDAASGVLALSVVYKGNTDGFCSKVDGHKMTESGSLAVTGVNGQDVTISAQPM